MISVMLAAEAPAQPKLGFLVTVDGAVAGLVTSLFIGIITFLMIDAARRGKPIPTIRRIPGLEAIDEGVGRATETGRAVLVANRTGIVTGVGQYAVWGYLHYVAKLCAQYDTELMSIGGNALAVAVSEDIVRQAHIETGRLDSFRRENVRFIPNRQWAWTSAVCGWVKREKPATCLWIGDWYAESMVLAETGRQVGAIQIAATQNVNQLPFFVAACDYTLIGEEMFAGSAYLSKNPVLTGTVVAVDIAKYVVFAIVVLGFIAQAVNPEANLIDRMLRF